ncbi:Spc97 / Spc98 family protein [Toxoplasma gondii GT1]|uniref:Spc97 / Spc98 family protein n=2 Tax=Toxoplasma gondii TaxID=5811 RepID=S7USA6_TOXGG|nr:Spc97 / Spc98 family protein [Toxoplasma gondii GT1]KAF4639190.1 Spc97 / Spc98 family protein [Toxoplasma gondii]
MEDPGESRAPGAEAHSGPRRTISHSSHSSSHSIPSVGSFAASSLTRLASLIATAPLPPELRAAFPAHANPEKNSSPEKQAELQRVLEESVLSRVARAQATYGVAAPEASDSKTVHAQRQQVYGHLMRELSASPSPRAAAALPALVPRLERLLLSATTQSPSTPLQRPESIFQLLLHLAELRRAASRRVEASAFSRTSQTSDTAAKVERKLPHVRASTVSAATTPRSIRCESISSVHTAQTDGTFPQSAGPRERRGERRDSAREENAFAGRRGDTAESSEVLDEKESPHELGLVYDLSGVSEVALLRDIVYTLQGVDGVHVLFDEKLQTYLLSPKVRASNSLRALVSHLAGVGALYRRLVHALQAPEHGGSDAGHEGQGVVAQALRQCMQEQLQEYHRLVAAVEQDVLRSAEDGAWSSITLRRFAVWLQEPFCRMRALAALAEEAKGLKGGPLLSTIYAHSLRGDPELRVLMLHILKRAAEPVTDMIHAWIDHGELRDPAGEFFVTQRSQCAVEDLWDKRYFVNVDRIPVFFPPSLASEILRVGKSLNFMRLCMDPAEAEAADFRFPSLSAPARVSFAVEQSKRRTCLPPTVESELARHCDENALRKEETWRGAEGGLPRSDGEKTFAAFAKGDAELAWVNELREKVRVSSATKNKRVVTCLLEKHQLLFYLEGIRKFILLEDGEFTRSLLEAAESHEEQRRSQSAEREFQGLCAEGIAAQPAILAAVDAAARGSGAGAALSEICPALLHALRVRFPPAPVSGATAGEAVGSVSAQRWNEFYLDFKLGPPLSCVCTPGVMGAFHKMFCLQWKLRRAAHAVTSAWLQGRSLYRLQQALQQRKEKRVRENRQAANSGQGNSARQGPSTPRGISRRRSRTPTPARGNAALRREEDGRDQPFLWEKLREKEEQEQQSIAQQRCLGLLNEVAQALSHLQVYLVEDLLNPTWRRMMRLLMACNDFDELLAVHQQCVETLSDGMFLYDAETLQSQLQAQQNASTVGAAGGLSTSACSNPIIMALIQELLFLVSQVTATARTLFSSLEAAATDSDEARGQREREAAAAGASQTLQQIQPRVRGVLLELLRQIEVKQAHVRSRAGATVKGVAFGDRGDALRALRCSLDFNAFYDHQAQLAAGSPPLVLLPALSPAVSPVSPYHPGASSLSYPTLLRRALPGVAAAFLPSGQTAGQEKSHQVLLQLLLLHQRRQQEDEQRGCMQPDGAAGRRATPSPAEKRQEVPEGDAERDDGEGEDARFLRQEMRQQEERHAALLRCLPWLRENDAHRGRGKTPSSLGGAASGSQVSLSSGETPGVLPPRGCCGDEGELRREPPGREIRCAPRLLTARGRREDSPSPDKARRTNEAAHASKSGAEFFEGEAEARACKARESLPSRGCAEGPTRPPSGPASPEDFEFGKCRRARVLSTDGASHGQSR